MINEFRLEDFDRNNRTLIVDAIENMSLDDQIDISKDGVRVAVIVSSDWLDEVGKAFQSVRNLVKEL